MPIDKKLVQQVKATSTKPRNFFFVPGADDGIVGMSAKKLSATDVKEAKDKLGAKKVIRGQVSMVDNELIFLNETNDDTGTETKLRKALKLATGLTTKIHLVKSTGKVAEIDEAVDNADNESGTLSDDEQAKMQKAEFKLRRTQVARRVDLLRELMPEALTKLEPLSQDIASLEIEEDYKKGFAKVEKLELLIQKLLPGAVANAYKTRLVAVDQLIKQLTPLDGGAAANFQEQVNAAMNFEAQGQNDDAVQTLIDVEPKVKQAIARARGGDDGVGRPTDATDYLSASDKFVAKAKAVKVAVLAACQWADLNAPQMKQWDAKYQEALRSAKVFKHDAAVALLADVETGIAAAERVRTELGATLPRTRAVLTAARQDGEIGGPEFQDLDNRLTRAQEDLRQLRYDEARQRAQLVQAQVLKLRNANHLYTETSKAVRQLLQGVVLDIKEQQARRLIAKNTPNLPPDWEQQGEALRKKQGELITLKSKFDTTESLAQTKGFAAAYDKMTELEAEIRSQQRMATATTPPTAPTVKEVDATSHGAEMVAGKSDDARALKLKLELENVRRALPTVAGFDPDAATVLEEGVKAVVDAQKNSLDDAEDALAPLIGQLKFVLNRLKASRVKAHDADTPPVRPTTPLPPVRPTNPLPPVQANPLPPAQESTEAWSGRIGNVNDYTTGAVLGGGSKGTAKLMTNPNDPDAPPLVVKFTTEEPASLYKEAENYEKLGDHPNIAKCLGVREVDGQKGLVMEAVRGKSAAGLADNLRARLTTGEISQEEYWSTVQYTLAKTLEGLAHMHKAGFTHNDIKPDNVMVDQETGEVKLIDLGGVEGVGTEFDTGKGSEYTAGFVAPERFDESSTPQTDAFSAGASAYEMAEGKEFEYNRKDQVRSATMDEYDKIVALYKAPEEAMTRANDNNPLTRQVDSKGQDVPSDEDVQGATTVKEPGRYAANTSYVEFLNALMHPDADKRLSPEEALQHPFLRDRMLDDDKVKAVVQKALGDSETPTQGKEPERERFHKAMTGIVVSNQLTQSADVRTRAQSLDIADLDPANLITTRADLTNRLRHAQEAVRLLVEPIRLLERIIASAVVTDNDRHAADLKLLDEIRQIKTAYTVAESHLRAGINEIDERIADGDVVQDGATAGGFTPQDLEARKQALQSQRNDYEQIKGSIEGQPSPELSQQLDNLERFRAQVDDLKEQATLERAMMQGIVKSLSAHSAKLARGEVTAVAREVGEHRTKLSTIADALTRQIDTLKAELDQADAEFKDLQKLRFGVGVKIMAARKAEVTAAANYDKAAKAPRDTADQMTAFEEARKSYEEADAGRTKTRETLRKATEQVIARLTSLQKKVGPRLIPGRRDFATEIADEISKLKESLDKLLSSAAFIRPQDRPAKEGV